MNTTNNENFKNLSLIVFPQTYQEVQSSAKYTPVHRKYY
jgi:hypothetical protein